MIANELLVVATAIILGVKHNPKAIDIALSSHDGCGRVEVGAVVSHVVACSQGTFTRESGESL